MLTRGVDADTSKRRQKYGGKNNSNFGPAAKVNGTLGWVLKMAVERGPDEKGLLGIKEERGMTHLGPISNRLEPKVQKMPNEEGLLVFTEDCGPSHLGPLPNTHINCMEVGRPTLDSLKGLVEVGRPTIEDSSGVRARGSCCEVVCGCPKGVDFSFQQGSFPLAPNTKVVIDKALMEEAFRYTVSISRAFF